MAHRFGVDAETLTKVGTLLFSAAVFGLAVYLPWFAMEI